MRVRYVSFNFFERNLKNVSLKFCYAQALESLCYHGNNLKVWNGSADTDSGTWG